MNSTKSNMAAPVVHERVKLGDKKTPVLVEDMSREEPFPVKLAEPKKLSPLKCEDPLDITVSPDKITDSSQCVDKVMITEPETMVPDSDIDCEITGNNNNDIDHSDMEPLVILDEPMSEKSSSPNSAIINTNYVNDINEHATTTVTESHDENSVMETDEPEETITIHPKTDLLVPSAVAMATVNEYVAKVSNSLVNSHAHSDILEETALNLSNITTPSPHVMETGQHDLTPVVDLSPKPPYKGIVVRCGQLKDYLDSLPTFNRKCMLRKGREVHKIYVDMTKGETFLDDQFAYTEFGKMVLTNGSIRAGRAKNAKQIVVARETLYCSGTAACKRACGGYGICLTGCDKTKMRGHRCSYRIKLTQRLGFVNFWFVEELGSHDQLVGKDCDFKVNSQLPGPVNPAHQPLNAVDLSKVRKPSSNNNKIQISRSPKKEMTPSPDRSLNHSMTNTRRGTPTESDMTNYHYVLGLMPSASGSPSSTSSRASPSSSSDCLPDGFPTSTSSSQQQQQQQRAMEMYREFAAQFAMSAAAHAVTPGVTSDPSHVISPATPLPTLPLNIMNYMPDITDMSNLAALHNPFNQLLVNVKQEPLDTQGQGQGQLMYPMAMPYSPTRISKSHSPSPSRDRGHSAKEKSPLTQQQSSPSMSIQRGIEIENKIKNEIPQLKTQAQQETLGQVHNRIMERAKARKKSLTTRVPQKIAQAHDGNGHSYSETELNMTSSQLNIPTVSSMTSNSKIDNKTMSSVAFNRFQTLNHILQSEAFQKAKIQLENEKRKKSETDTQQQDMALNLTVNQSKTDSESAESENIENHSKNYFKLIEEWNKGGQLNGTENSNDCEGIPNGNAALENLPETESDQLTENEKELMCRVRQLESHVKQLQNIVIKREGTGDQPSTSRRKKAQREFDFAKYNTRHVALKILYLGCDYQGFASQEETVNTIEAVLFDALKKTRLIESRETSCYHRCGRTDKGVSAFGQVISIDLRSNLTSGVGVKVKEGGTATQRPGDKTTEIRYCHILNKTLPPEIRVLAWTPVNPDFSARFSCTKRTYKYMFPKGKLDIKLMDTAVQRLIGEHDYRNLCKMDIANGVTNFTRKIISGGIETLDDQDNGYTMCELTIVGSSFLWHQIRCIVAIIFLIGQGKEQPQIIDELLDIEKNPRKPQYNMASEIPLCLYDAEFGNDFEWIYEADWHEDNIRTIQQMWAQHTVRATLLKRMLEDLDKAKVETECDIAPWSDLSPPVLGQGDWLLANSKMRVYKPLMERQTAESLEDRLEHFAKKRKLTTSTEESTVTSPAGE